MQCCKLAGSTLPYSIHLHNVILTAFQQLTCNCILCSVSLAAAIMSQCKNVLLSFCLVPACFDVPIIITEQSFNQLTYSSYAITSLLFVTLEGETSVPPASLSSLSSTSPSTPAPDTQTSSIIAFAAVLIILVIASVTTLFLCLCYGFCKLHSRPASQVPKRSPSSRRNSVPIHSPCTPKLQSGSMSQRTPTHSTSFHLPTTPSSAKPPNTTPHSAKPPNRAFNLPTTPHSARPYNSTTKSFSFNNSPINTERGYFPSSSSAPRLHPPDIAVLSQAQTPSYSDSGSWQGCKTNNHGYHLERDLPTCMESRELCLDGSDTQTDPVLLADNQTSQGNCGATTHNSISTVSSNTSTRRELMKKLNSHSTAV